MKFLTAVTICLVLSAGAQASFLDDLKNTFSGVGSAFQTTFSGVVDQGKQLGSSLLGQLQTQGTQLLSQAAQSLMLNVMNNLQGTAAPATKKRDLASMVGQAQGAVDNVKQMLSTGVTKYGTMFESALNKLKGIVSNIESLPVDQLVNSVDSVVSTHNALADTLLKDLVQSISQRLTSAATSVSNKRDLSSLFGTVSSGLENFLKPNVDTLKQIVTEVGNNLKTTATQMQGAVDQNLVGLQKQLLGHLGQLTANGKDMLQQGTQKVDAIKQMIGQAMLEQ